MSNKDIIVVDLDGTLIRGNSFSMLCKRLLLNDPTTFPTARIILKRKLRLISHEKAKQLILDLVEKSGRDGWYSQFMLDLQSSIRMPLYREIYRDVLQGKLVLLATAAPAFYVKDLCRNLKLTHYLATEIGKPENKGEEKNRRVKWWVEKKDGVIRKIFTDNRDDLDLMFTGGLHKADVFLVNPTVKSFNELEYFRSKFRLADYSGS